MGRKIALFSIVLTVVFFHFCLAHAQIAEKEKSWEKTITLPSGEVIYDLNGEWAVCTENYGPWAEYGMYPDIVEIKQEGASFVGIRLIGNPWVPRGSEHIRGELDENGFKKIQILTGIGFLDAKGQILPWGNIGNKIIVDDGEKVRATLIRR
jgi:hypothetical protein